MYPLVRSKSGVRILGKEEKKDFFRVVTLRVPTATQKRRRILQHLYLQEIVGNQTKDK